MDGNILTYREHKYYKYFIYPLRCIAYTSLTICLLLLAGQFLLWALSGMAGAVNNAPSMQMFNFITSPMYHVYLFITPFTFLVILTLIPYPTERLKNDIHVGTEIKCKIKTTNKHTETTGYTTIYRNGWAVGGGPNETTYTHTEEDYYTLTVSEVNKKGCKVISGSLEKFIKWKKFYQLDIKLFDSYDDRNGTTLEANAMYIDESLKTKNDETFQGVIPRAVVSSVVPIVCAAVFVLLSVFPLTEIFILQKSLPISLPLKDLVCVDASESQGGFAFYDDVTDNKGNSYQHGIGGRNGDIENFEVYEVNSEYTRIKGTVVLEYDSREKRGATTFLQIFGDDVLLYKSPLITTGCEPANFNADISGVHLLKVQITGSAMIRLVDCILIRDVDIPLIGTWVLESTYRLSDKRSTSAESLLNSEGYKDGEVYILIVSEDGKYSWSAYNHPKPFSGTWEAESANSLIITDDGDASIQKLVFSKGKITWDWEGAGIGNVFVRSDGSEKLALPK